MKKLTFLFLLLAGLGISAHAQGVRFDSQVTQVGTILSTTNVVLVPSGAIINICSAPANAVPCSNLATTYTDATLVTPCATSTQIVISGTTNCVASPDAESNWGVWVNPGQYAYTVTVGGSNFGPYYFTAGSPGSTPSVKVNGSIISNPNFNSATPSPDAGNTAIPFKVSGADVIAEIPDCTGTVGGRVSTPPNDSGKFYNGTCQWSKPTILGTNAIYATDSTYAGGVKADAHQVWDASWTSGSTTVAATAGDVDFTTQAHVGDIMWGVKTGNIFASAGTLLFAQGTISSITDSHHVVVSTTSSASCATSGSTSCIFTWGTHDDTAAWTAFWSAVIDSQCATGIAPVGYSIIQSAAFNANPSASQIGKCYLSMGNLFTGPSIIGTGGFGGTVLLPSPNFDPTSCTGGTGAACTFGATAIHVTSIYVWGSGIGNIGSGFNGKNLVEFTGGVGLEANPYVQDFTVSGWGETTTGSTGILMDHASEVYLRNVISLAGATACKVTSLNANEYVYASGLDCVGGSDNPCGLYWAANGFMISNGGIYGNCVGTNTNNFGSIFSAGRVNSTGDQFANFGGGATPSGSGLLQLSGGAVANLTSDVMVDDAVSGQGINIADNSGVQLNIQNTAITMSGTGSFAFASGGGTDPFINDLGGNTFSQQAAGGEFYQTIGPNVTAASCSGVATSSATLYLQFLLGTSGIPACTNTTANVLFVAPSAGKIWGLYVKAGSAGHAAGSGVFTVFKNGSSTAATCTVGTALLCAYRAGASPITFAQNDLITLQYTTQGSETLADIKVTLWLQR